MKILVTGAKGFIGKNLIAELRTHKEYTFVEFDQDDSEASLTDYCCACDFVFHLAGINRPINQKDFVEGNVGFLELLLQKLRNAGNYCPVLLTSSTQAALDNPYGKSKRNAEELLFNYQSETDAKALVYRLPNVFGKWCRPNYNSAIATFCHNISRGLPITVNDPKVELNLVYIDDVIREFLNALNGSENMNGNYCEVQPVHHALLGEIVDLLHSFAESRKDLSIPDLQDGFTKKLYSTFLSYLPEDKFSYLLKMNVDDRGSFTEFLKTPERGQVSINISKPGITKGNHWHHTKTEKFLVVSGEGVIRFKKIGTEKVLEYFVSDKKLEVVDIPPGYTHNIENLGDSDMVTVMWANEKFDQKNPDTFFEPV